MISPYPWQQPNVDRMVEQLAATHTCVADTSRMGSGKTIMSLAVAKELHLRPMVITTKSVIPDWEITATKMGIPDLQVINYELLVARKAEPNWGEWRNGGAFYEFESDPDERPPLLIFDEAHKVSGMSSKSSKLLLAASRQKIPHIVMSATLANSPLKFKSLGKSLGLHSSNGLPGFPNWLKRHQCVRIQGMGWQFFGTHRTMERVRDDLGDRIGSVEPQGMPDSAVSTLMLPVADPRSLDREYAADLETQESTAKNDGVALLRSRQLSELAKLPALIDRIRNTVQEGACPVVFVNFRDTVARLCEAFPECSVVVGEQTAATRQHNVQQFQQAKSDIMIASLAAGGSSINLQDTKGDRPRITYLLPGFNALDIIQALGRTPRVGGKSPCTQYLCLASGSLVEHRVANNFQKNINNIESLQNTDLI